MSRPIQSALNRSIAYGAPGRQLGRTRDALNTLNTQLATGMRILKPSDDPSGFDQAKGLTRLQERLAQHQRSISAATLWTDQTQVELDALSEIFSTAKETGLRGANGVLGYEDLAKQVESLRAEAIDRLNATSNGEYLFAGNETKTAPIDASGAIAAGDFSGQRQREIAPGVTVTLNTTEALQVDGVSTPDRLQALADALRTEDQSAITAALEGIDAGVDHYIRLGGLNGNTVRTLQNASAMIEQQDVILGERRASIEEIDLAETLSAIQLRQTGLEAALRATAASIQQSLVNYL
ncbi:MAG: hypothetical protein AAF170_13700 [Bacteroidota bacterium]